jgi:hypothetical protein
MTQTIKQRITLAHCARELRAIKEILDAPSATFDVGLRSGRDIRITQHINVMPSASTASARQGPSVAAVLAARGIHRDGFMVSPMLGSIIDPPRLPTTNSSPPALPAQRTTSGAALARVRSLLRSARHSVTRLLCFFARARSSSDIERRRDVS